MTEVSPETRAMEAIADAMDTLEESKIEITKGKLVISLDKRNARLLDQVWDQIDRKYRAGSKLAGFRWHADDRQLRMSLARGLRLLDNSSVIGSLSDVDVSIDGSNVDLKEVLTSG